MKKALTYLSAAGGVVGTFLAATLGGTCCVGPATVALLGVNGAALASGLHPYRMQILGISLFLLLIALRRSRQPCSSGACAAPPP